MPEIVCPSCGSSFQLECESTASWSPRRGERRVGRFTLIDKVGVGAFGTVYKARDPELDRVVAIKVPRAGNLSTADDRARFVREAANTAQLRHPSIVPVHEVGEHEGTPFIVSEFVAGVTLSDWLTGRKPTFPESARWQPRSRTRSSTLTNAGWSTGTSSRRTFCSTSVVNRN